MNNENKQLWQQAVASAAASGLLVSKSSAGYEVSENRAGRPSNLIGVVHDAHELDGLSSAYDDANAGGSYYFCLGC